MKSLKTRALFLVFSSCLLTGIATGQDVPNVNSGVETTDINPAESSNHLGWLPIPWSHRRSCACTTCDMQRCWEAGYYFGSVEYLMSWSKPRSVPELVTTSDPGTPDPPAGILGFPTTQTLFGGGNLGSDLRHGGQITVGRWLGVDGELGLGIRLMSIESSTADFSATSSGTPILARPFVDVTLGLPGSNSALVIAHPTVGIGEVTAQSRNDIMTGELYLRRQAWIGKGFEVEFLAGYQITRMDDMIDVNTTTDSLAGMTEMRDLFEARNTFHGGSLGLSANFHHGNIHFKALGKIGLGNMNERVTIDGVTTFTAAGPSGPVTTAGGLLALPTNMGEHVRNEFVYVPEVMMTVAYDWCENLQFTAGYRFTYWSRVILAGDQIDTRVNTTQMGGGTLSGPAFPDFQFGDTDFWVQGMRLGFNWTY